MLSYKLCRGCSSTYKVKLIKKCDPIQIYVPGGFIPDGNGLNDLLKPVLSGYIKLNFFRIYDRYGQILFTATGNTNGWDGTCKGKLLSTQAVVWVVEAVNVNGGVDLRSGTSIIIR